MRQHIIADLSVNHIERQILRCGCSVERIQHDYGIDLVLFSYDARSEIEPGQIYMQLKATDPSHPAARSANHLLPGQAFGPGALA